MLKNLQNESILSMVLGAAVVVLAGILAFNYFRTPRQPIAPETAENESLETATPEGELTTPTAAVALPTVHTVAAGETLWSIAQKYFSSGYNYPDIARINNLKNPGQIEVGQQLTIPKAEPKQLTVGVIKPTVTANRIEGTQYTAVKGDSLWEIALRAYGDPYRWPEIARANNLTRPGVIHAGNVFIIPR